MWNSQYTSDYLMHHGILGMKWGVRRYQNEDGSLTAAGRIRYNQDEHGNLTKKTKEETRKEKDLQKRQAAWDKDVQKNYVKAYNRAAETFNKTIDNINSKWEREYGSYWNMPRDKQIEYDREVQSYLNQLVDTEISKIVGTRPK